jgi:hypothetical protein
MVGDKIAGQPEVRLRAKQVNRDLTVQQGLQVASGLRSQAGTRHITLARGTTEATGSKVEPGDFLIMEGSAALDASMHEGAEAKASDQGPELGQKDGRERFQLHILQSVQAQTQAVKKLWILLRLCILQNKLSEDRSSSQTNRVGPKSPAGFGDGKIPEGLKVPRLLELNFQEPLRKGGERRTSAASGLSNPLCHGSEDTV